MARLIDAACKIMSLILMFCVIGSISEFSDGNLGSGFGLALAAALLGTVIVVGFSKSTRIDADRIRLQLSIGTRKRTTEDLSITLLEFKTKGVFSLANPIIRPCFEIKLTDITEGDPGMPVLTVIDDLQDDETTEFRFRQAMDSPLAAGAGSDSWVTIAGVPVEILVFPSSGARRIKVVLNVLDLADHSIVVSQATTWDHAVDGTGYLEHETTESEAQVEILKLAMCLAASDGVVDDSEVQVIKDWGKKSVGILPEARKDNRRKSFNVALRDVTEKIRSGRRDEVEAAATRALFELGESRLLYDAYELCLHVLKADGEAHPDEMAQLTRVARGLGLEDAKVQMLADRHLTDVTFSTVAGSATEDDKMLGITPEMTKDEIRRLLNRLYNKHRGRREHNDPDVRNRSREWLDRITNARVRHIK